MVSGGSAAQEYRPDIDGLRAIAVLAVVGFHAFPGSVPGGFVGVDIFFVISGFLISSLILVNLAAGTFRFADFYGRRIRRIFPALSIVLLVCLAIGWAVLLPDEYHQLGQHTAAGAAFSANLQLWREAGYFDAASERKPLLHLWSLGIEEQFYLIWPACLVILWKWKSKALGAMAALAVLSFAWNLVDVGWDPTAAFYLPFARFWELLSGCLLAYVSVVRGGAAARVSGRNGVANAMAGAGLLLIAAAIFLLNRNRLFPGVWALLPAVGTVLLIAAGPDAIINRRVLRHPALVWVGLISYPLYLWHWPLLCFARMVAVATPALKLAVIGLSFLLAWATWKFVEAEVRRRGKRIAGGVDILVLCGALAVVCLLGLGVQLAHGFPRRLPATARAVLPDFEPPMAGLTFYYGPSQLANLNLDLQARPGQPDAALLGDSHARSLFPGLVAADPGRNWLVLGNDACPPTLGITVETVVAHCAEKMKEAYDYLAGPQAPEIVVFSFYGYYAETTDFAADQRMNGKGPSMIRLTGERPGQPKEEVLYSGLEAGIQLLTEHRRRVYLIIDIPELPFLPRDCVMRPLFASRTPYSLERTVVDQRQLGLRRIVRRLQARFPALGVFDPLPLLCDSQECKPVSAEFSYYQDSHHLSLRGSEILAGALLEVLNRNEANR